MTGELAIEHIRQVVAAWATTEPLIRRAYLFGSRARGDARPDSDVDVALLHDLDPEVVRQCRGDAFSARWFTWGDSLRRWREGLAPRLPVPVQLEAPWGRDGIVRPSLKECRICLYRRAAPTSGPGASSTPGM